jgi:hypothetical protein
MDMAGIFPGGNQNPDGIFPGKRYRKPCPVSTVPLKYPDFFKGLLRKQPRSIQQQGTLDGVRMQHRPKKKSAVAIPHTGSPDIPSQRSRGPEKFPAPAHDQALEIQRVVQLTGDPNPGWT